MSSLPAVVRNSAVLLAGTGASKALVFVSYLVLVRKLGAEDFGLYSLVFAWLAFFELLPDAGLDPLLVRETTRGESEAGRLLGDALLLRTLLALAALPLAALVFPRLAGDPRAVTLVLLAALTWISSNRRPSLRSLFEVPYRNALRMGIPTLLGVLTEAAHLAMLVPLVAAAGLAGAVAAQGLAALPFAVVLAVLSARRLRPRLVPERARLAGLFRRTVPLLGLLAANMVLSRIDVLMLQLLRDAREVGIYSAPVRLVEVANLLPILLMTSVYPLFAAAWPEDPARIDGLFRRSLRLLTAVLVPVVAVEVAFARPIVAALFGAEFADSAAVLPVLAITEVGLFADIVLNSRLLAERREHRNLQLLVAAAVTNVAANLVLIPARGAVGAAEATLLAYAVRVAAALLPADTRPAGRAALASVLPAVAAGAAALGLAAGSRLAPLPAAVVGAAAYVALLAAFGGLRPREIREILRALRRPAG